MMKFMFSLRPHQLGVFVLGRPLMGALLLLLAVGLSVLGISMIRSDFSIASMFATDNEQFSQYQQFKRAFPLNDRDVIIVLRSDEFDRQDLELLSNLHLDLEFFDGVDGVLSAFTMPEPTDSMATALPHIPEDLPSGEILKRTLDEFSDHPLSNKFLGRASSGERWMVMVTTFSNEAIGPHTVLPTLAALDELLRQKTENSTIRFDLVGVPVLEGMFKTGGRSDRRIFNLAGLLIGLVVSAFFLRDIRFVSMVFICPVLSVAATYGTMGLAGREFSLLMGAAPPLIMVVAFANAMHLVKPILTAMQNNEDRDTATAKVLREVGPSCFLALLTTGLALLSLIVSASGAIRDFAFISSIGMAMIFVICMLVVPLAAKIVLPPRLNPPKQTQASWTFAIASKIASWLPKRQITVLAISLLLVAALSILHSQLTVNHRLSDEVPRHARAIINEANRDIATTSPNPLFIAVRYPQIHDAASDAVITVLEELQAELSALTETLDIWSVLSIRSSLSGEQTLSEVLEELPPLIKGRFVSESERAHLVTLFVENMDSASIMELVAELRPALDLVSDRHTEFEIVLTGISLVSADHATTTIPDLHLSMWIAIAMVFGFISLFFKSLSMAFFAVLPNVLPIVATGAILQVFGWGLGYASVIALTVAFGVAVDDTIHFLARYRLQIKRGAPGEIAVVQAIREIGPIVITTTVVLVLGLLATVFGQMPHTRVFGVLCCVTLISALISDLFVLPTVIMNWHNLPKLMKQRAGKVRPAASE